MKPLPDSHPAANAEVRVSQLLPGQRRLVHLMAEVGFGEIKRLHVCAGQPSFEPAPSVTRELRFNDRTVSPLRSPGKDFVLCRQVHELLRTLERLGDGMVDRLEIRHGLPNRVFLTDSHIDGRPT